MSGKMSTAPSALTHHNSTYSFIDPSRHAGQLKGRTALVTGAGRGIGQEMARALAGAGARVVVVARRQGDVNAVARQLNQTHGDDSALAVAADVSDPAAAEKVLEAARAAWGAEKGAIDVLVANAGMTRFNAFLLEDGGLDAWWRVLEVNLRGAATFLRAVLPGMVERRRGTVISVVSTSGSQDIPFNTAYATSKAALIKLNQDLHGEVGDKGVRCFALHPGTVDTDLATTEGAINMEAFEAWPKMQEMAQGAAEAVKQTADLPANTCVTLCVEPDAKLLSGKYVDSEQDLGEVLVEARKGADGRIEKERLYWLGVKEL